MAVGSEEEKLGLTPADEDDQEEDHQSGRRNELEQAASSTERRGRSSGVRNPSRLSLHLQS